MAAQMLSRLDVAETWDHLYYRVPACEWNGLIKDALSGQARPTDQVVAMPADFTLGR